VRGEGWNRGGDKGRSEKGKGEGGEGKWRKGGKEGQGVGGGLVKLGEEGGDGWGKKEGEERSNKRIFRGEREGGGTAGER